RSGMGEVERRHQDQSGQDAKRRRHLGGASLHHGPRRRYQRRHPHTALRPGAGGGDQFQEELMARFWIAALLIAQAGCVQTERPALARAAAYLWSQQAEDGGWHSRTYGLLRSGQSLTPFVLEALLEVPAEVYAAPAGKVDRALAFIERNQQSDGMLGM